MCEEPPGNEEGHVIQVTALVYYNGRDKFGRPCTVNRDGMSNIVSGV